MLWEAIARDFDLDLNDDISSFYACILGAMTMSVKLYWMLGCLIVDRMNTS
jgi:hypothetical protein